MLYFNTLNFKQINKFGKTSLEALFDQPCIFFLKFPLSLFLAPPVIAPFGAPCYCSLWRPLFLLLVAPPVFAPCGAPCYCSLWRPLLLLLVAPPVIALCGLPCFFLLVAPTVIAPCGVPCFFSPCGAPCYCSLWRPLLLLLVAPLVID